MKGRVIALGEIGGRPAAALIVDGRLDDLIADPPPEAGPRPGEIHRGRAERLMKGQGGIFVSLAGGARGFLRDTKGIAPGRPVLVQVQGTAEPGKAVPLTTRLILKGRAAIVTPGAPGINVSRQLRDEDARTRLLAIAEGAGVPGDTGLILRSAAAAAPDAAVAGEIAALLDLAARIAGDVAGAPELLLDAADAHEAAMRDWTDPPPDAVEEGPDAFARAGIEAAVAALGEASVPLQGGAGMVIEPTRALIAVDVNTGGDTPPAAGLTANIAAIRELPRQLRLRGLGGIVVIDLAPLSRRDRAAFEQQARAAFRGDTVETTLAGFTPAGNYELIRRRDRFPLAAITGTRA